MECIYVCVCVCVKMCHDKVRKHAIVRTRESIINNNNNNNNSEFI